MKGFQSYPPVHSSIDVNTFQRLLDTDALPTRFDQGQGGRIPHSSHGLEGAGKTLECAIEMARRRSNLGGADQSTHIGRRTCDLSQSDQLGELRARIVMDRTRPTSATALGVRLIPTQATVSSSSGRRLLSRSHACDFLSIHERVNREPTLGSGSPSPPRARRQLQVCRLPSHLPSSTFQADPET